MSLSIENTEGANRQADSSVDHSSGKDKKLAKPRRWRKRIVLITVVLACLACGLGAWAKVSFDRIERAGLQLHEAGDSVNKFLEQYAIAIERHDVESLLGLYDSDYLAEEEGLWDLELQSERDGVQVYRWRIGQPRAFIKEDIRQQAEHHFASVRSIDKVKFKISWFEELAADAVTLRSVLWIRGYNPDGDNLESRVWFRMRLRRIANRDWKIANKEMLHGETVIGTGQGFTDITKQVGITYEARQNSMLDEAKWRPSTFGIMKYSNGGVTTADYDGDGWVDVFFADGEASRLYRNTGHGEFEDVTKQAGLPLEVRGGTFSLIVDFDNDGDRELLFCRSTGKNLLFRNNGDGTFTDVSENANVQGIWVPTGAAADYNNDGLVDIYLGRYLDPRTNLPTTSFYTRNSEGNALLRNDGDLHFTDVTEEAGVRDGGLTLGVAWADYDEDGDQDIYVANDFGRNALFQNNGDGTFDDVSRETGTTNMGYGMSSSWADIDNDGDLDIYVAGLHSSQRWIGHVATINRYITTSIREGTFFNDYQEYAELYGLLGFGWTGLGDEVLMGNTLMLNNGDGTFTNATESCRVNPHGWYWSSAMFDFDNDGLQDIYTVNGWITGKVKDDL